MARVAVLALALVFMAAGCGGSSSSPPATGPSSSGSTAAAPAARGSLTIGSKNFTEQYVLGELYRQALEAKGYTVHYKQGIGSSELIDTAITSGRIDFYPEYTGVIVQDLAHKTSPKTAAATYAAAKAFEESRGLTLLARTPFYDSDSFGMLKTTAKKEGLKTIPDVKRLPKLSFGGFPEFRTRATGLVGLRKVYGLTNIDFVPLAGISVYAALDQHKVQAGDVFSTDPQLASGKYTILTDTKHLFGFQNVAPVVSKKVAQRLGPDFAQTVDAVSAKLTLKAMIAMNRAVAIEKQTPAAVARTFLTANGLA